MASNIALADYDTLRAGLKTFLKNQSVFSDYDFDGSAMSVLIDLLAYNSYMTNFYGNMVQNESFLDTAVVRSSVVSRAKALGYTPYSRKSAEAKLFVTFNPNDSPTFVLIPNGTRFQTTISGRQYIFTTAADFSATFNSVTGLYEREVTVYEGVVTTQTFTYNAAAPQRMYLLDDKIDTSSLVVTWAPNIGSTSRTAYTLATGLPGIEPDSTVFFLQEDVNGLYEIYFGDGILGKALANGEVVRVSYRISNGDEVNGATSFSAPGYVGQNSTNSAVQYLPNTIDLTQAAAYGSDRESISSIKFNAPKSYARQNRVVTVADYESFLSENFPEIESFSVWGGQDNNPPIYGKTYICAKPVDAYVLSNSRKDDIVEEVSKYALLTNETVMVDPLFTFMKVDSTVYYDSNKTTKTADTMFSSIVTAMQDFEATTLNKFTSGFFKSKLATAIDSADPAIKSNTTTFKLEKRLRPIFNSSITYQMDFHASLEHPYDGFLGTLSSEGFYLSGSSDVYYLDDDGLGNIRSYTISNVTKVYTNTTFGTIDYANGVIQLDSVIFSNLVDVNGELKIYVTPTDDFYSPIRNEILLLSYPKITLFNTATNAVVKIDTISTLGNDSSLSSAYVLTPVTI
jgi:hypothetical protein